MALKDTDRERLKAAGWVELWKDHSGRLWTRNHAMNILRSRKGASHVSTEDVRNCIEGTCTCDDRAAKKE